MSIKNSNDTSWDRTSDLPICSTDLNHCATAVPFVILYHDEESELIIDYCFCYIYIYVMSFTLKTELEQ